MISDYAGKGYATEGLKAFMPAYFERVPSACITGDGHDVLDGYVDPENIASQKVLEKCGFTRCEILHNDYNNPTLGMRDSIVYRLARPGKTLEELGLVMDGGDEPPPEPPVQ
jgi:RimJ/RimL family protein N-acetyltransferase